MGQLQKEAPFPGNGASFSRSLAISLEHLSNWYRVFLLPIAIANTSRNL